MHLPGQGHLELGGQHRFSRKLMYRAGGGNSERSPDFPGAEVDGLEYSVAGDRVAI